MRQSGRTFRMMIKAILCASEGNDVIIQCQNNVDIQQCRFIAKGILNGDIFGNFIDRDTIKIKSGGTIRFKTVKSTLEGYSNYMLFVDHYCGEC